MRLFSVDWINLFVDTWQSSPSCIMKQTGLEWSRPGVVWIWAARTRWSSHMSWLSISGRSTVSPLGGTVTAFRETGSFWKAYSAGAYEIKGDEIRFLTGCTYRFYTEFALYTLLWRFLIIPECSHSPFCHLTASPDQLCPAFTSQVGHLPIPRSNNYY